MDIGQLQSKYNERERVHQQNRDLVTKNCALQSQVDFLKKKVSDLETKLDENNQNQHK